MNYYPGSVSRIWTPNTLHDGLLELQISDQAKASPELTFDELLDSLAFGQMQRADVGHQKNMLTLQAMRRMDDIKNKATRLTKGRAIRRPYRHSWKST